jgi:uncharacterized peroxidase-related enzyme
MEASIMAVLDKKVYLQVADRKVSYEKAVDDLFNIKRSSLSRALKELIATVISKENDCDYCFYYHFNEMQDYGIDYDTASQVNIDFRDSKLDNRIKVLLEFCESLVSEQKKEISDFIINELLYYGWRYREIFDAVIICYEITLFNEAVSSQEITSDYRNATLMRTPIQR